MFEITEEKIKTYAEKCNLDVDIAKKHLEAMVEQMRTHEEKVLKVSSIEYLNWLYNFVQSNSIIDDETAYYQMEDGVDKENVMLLPVLQEVISKGAEEQEVPNILDETNEFQIYNYIFQYKDKFFQIDTMTGQGSITYISQVQLGDIDRKIVLI